MTGWVAPGKARERWLVYGAMGSWKSAGALEIARKVAGEMWVVDTDNAYEALLEREYADVREKVHVREVGDWGELVEGLDWAFAKAGPDDWVVVDSCSDAQDFGLDYFAGLIRGEDVADYIANWAKRNDQSELKKSGFQGTLIEMGVYDVFNPTWRKLLVRRVKAPGCHLYLTAQAAVAGVNPKEDAQTRALYGGVGWKPRTQKELGFSAATVLYVEKSKMGKGFYSCVKNWGRERTTGPLMNVPYNNLATDFLFSKCRWRPERTTDGTG